jgi:hypothetical protein
MADDSSKPAATSSGELDATNASGSNEEPASSSGAVLSGIKHPGINGE